MANIIGVEISYCFDGEDTYEHQIYADSLEEADDKQQKALYGAQQAGGEAHEQLLQIKQEFLRLGKLQEIQIIHAFYQPLLLKSIIRCVTTIQHLRTITQVYCWGIKSGQEA